MSLEVDPNDNLNSPGLDKSLDDTSGQRSGAIQFDQSLQLNASNAFLFADPKNIAFDESHNLDVSKIEDDQNAELKKLLLNIRQQMLVQKQIIIRDK